MRYMDKMAQWYGMTHTHGCQVKVYRDTKTRGFVAQIQTSSPALMPQHTPGTLMPMMEYDDPEEIGNEELDELREMTKQRITSRCGEILQFFEK